MLESWKTLQEETATEEKMLSGRLFNNISLAVFDDVVCKAITNSINVHKFQRIVGHL